MDAGLISAVLMLVAWLLGTVFLEPPGWFHGLLTVGSFLLIMRVVAIGTQKPKEKGSPPKGGRG